MLREVQPAPPGVEDKKPATARNRIVNIARLRGEKKERDVKRNKNDAIGPKATKRMRELSERMAERSRGNVKDGVELGRLLRPAKKVIGHDNWTTWLLENVACKDRHARRCMQISRAADLGLVKDHMTFSDALDAHRSYLEKQNNGGKRKSRAPKLEPQTFDSAEVQKFISQVVQKEQQARVFDVQSAKRGELERLALGAVRKAKKDFKTGPVIVTIRLTAE